MSVRTDFMILHLFVIDYGHPQNHSHPSNATFLYHDYYARTNEGDTVELCARLNQPLDEQLIVHYTTESEDDDWSAEEQGIRIV